MSKNKDPEIKITDPTEAVRQKYDLLLTVIIVVLFVGFITLLIAVLGLVIDAWNTKTLYSRPTNEYQVLEQRINEQSNKINFLIDEIDQQRYFPRPIR